MKAATKAGRQGSALRAIATATVLALLAVSQPQAQPAAPPRAQASVNDGSIARLRDVRGNVLVSNESGLATGIEALRLVPGTRVITTSASQVVVEFDDGCRVTLKENERFEVENKPCALLLAQPYGIVVAAAAAPLLAPGLVVGAAGAAALGVLVDSRTKTTASPN